MISLCWPLSNAWPILWRKPSSCVTVDRPLRKPCWESWRNLEQCLMTWWKTQRSRTLEVMQRREIGRWFSTFSLHCFLWTIRDVFHSKGKLLVQRNLLNKLHREVDNSLAHSLSTSVGILSGPWAFLRLKYLRALERAGKRSFLWISLWIWGTSIDREGREQRKYSLKLGFICYIIYNISTQGCKGEEEEKEEEEKEEEQEVKEGEKWKRRGSFKCTWRDCCSFHFPGHYAGENGPEARRRFLNVKCKQCIGVFLVW